jgi:predicted ABC-type ATPase
LREEGKDIFILGGPNGAGKTTAARILLPDWLPVDAFLNADEFARQISPGNVEAAALGAGRLILRKMHDLVRRRVSFAFETTCAARSYARFLHDCQEAGWRISLNLSLGSFPRVFGGSSCQTSEPRRSFDP